MKIMKKNILFGVVCVALLTATSCSDFLDVQPEGDARDNAYFLMISRQLTLWTDYTNVFIRKPCMVENYFGSRVLLMI